MTPVFPASQIHYWRRPDRLYQALQARRRAAPLDTALVQRLLAAYGLRLVGRPLPTSARGRSNTVIVGTSAGKKLLKEYKTTIEPSTALHEHSILRYLAEVGFPAPRVNQAASGTTLLQHGGRCYALFDLLEDYFQYHNYWLSPAQKRSCIAASGATLGCLHRTLWSFTPEGRHPSGFVARDGARYRELRWFSDTLRHCRDTLEPPGGWASQRGAQRFKAQADRVAADLARLDELLRLADPPRAIIHGDYGPYNLLFKPGAPIVVLDFELSRLDWRLSDLATALPSFVHSRLGFSFARMQTFVAAYREECPIDPAELALLPDTWMFLALRRVVVCWQRFCANGATTWLHEADRRLALVRWLERHRQRLVDCLAA